MYVEFIEIDDVVLVLPQFCVMFMTKYKMYRTNNHVDAANRCLNIQMEVRINYKQLFFIYFFFLLSLIFFFHSKI